MSLVRKIYIDSRTCSGDPADFTATLPEPIRADPSLGIILSQLTFVNNFNTVMAGYSDRLYFGVNVPDVVGVVTANVNDRVYLRVIDSRDTEAGAVDRIFCHTACDLYAGHIADGSADGSPDRLC